ncbi:hypothetical protein AXG93_3309s1250 [Marchantia polymorpha subsp. ruderalis]|uniref:pyruvate decarboxylase n=1 Tax=Marchantia polymorpha subsp. ruderalis TaxID=1480154 RepID=A0A176W4I5_MARPO|nr:hypothetical protein AXG93_3309s1250 [Marchantia polymorpha subsp. ruderalis]
MVFKNWKARYSKISSAEAAERLFRKSVAPVPINTPIGTYAPSNPSNYSSQTSSGASTTPSTPRDDIGPEPPSPDIPKVQEYKEVQEERRPYPDIPKVQEYKEVQEERRPYSASRQQVDVGMQAQSPTAQRHRPSAANYSVTMNNAPPETTLGRHIARRLVEIGVKDVFHVPGDFNLLLLDELLLEPQLNLVGCCNELNAGYAADGYARCKGVGAVVVTFTVGGLSVINSIAGAYSENLPVICIVGGPNSHDYGTSRILHHTIGHPDFSQELRCFQTVTLNDLNSAHEQVDYAISTSIRESKPVYISVSCNLPHISNPSFVPDLPFGPQTRISNPATLQASVDAAAEFLNRAVKPVLVCGPKIRVAKAKKACVEFAEAAGYPVAVMPSAKGLFPETYSKFIGTYWGAVSSPFALEIVESADAYIFIGPIFNDYSSVGYSLLIKKDKMLVVQPDRVTVGAGASYGCVVMVEFLTLLAQKVRKNEVAWENYKRIFVPPGVVQKSVANEPLRINVLFQYIQNMLNADTAVIAETGDSWFNCQKLKLPEGCGFEFQMQYGSIGWSVGATLGYAQAATSKRVISCIGDGSFQVTCQDISTMIRQNQRNIIFLINNGGYTIEVEIHDGPYNVIKNWDYCALVDAIKNGEGKVWTTRVKTEDELSRAVAECLSEKNRDNLCFIEIIAHKDDTSKELLEWGSRVSAANGRMSQILTE